ncbi:hypothetical protein [Deinococcus pimensis]|uniref:hypothetical protein n=1 Tax=Deinococcus pimensis TaxID=309888 RepID=UPI0004892E2B|nr:hypothetical protein [Deinococcus pimensis]
MSRPSIKLPTTLLVLTVTLAACGTNPATPDGAAGDPDFTLSVRSGVLNINPARTGTVTVRVTRPQTPKGNVTLSLEGAHVGQGADAITGTFSADQNGERAMTLTVGANMPAGTYPVTVRGTNGAVSKTLGVTVNVERWLLVDADRSANNWTVTPAHAPDPNAAPSELDLFMRAAMSARTTDVYAVQNASMDATSIIRGPSATMMRGYTGVVWYTGNQSYQRPVTQDFDDIAAYLGGDARRFVMISPALVVNLAGAANVFQTTSPQAGDSVELTRHKAFLRDVFGVAGYNAQYVQDAFTAQPVSAPASDVGPLDVMGGQTIRAAFSPLGQTSTRGLYTTGVTGSRGENVSASVALTNDNLGELHTSKATFLGVSPDRITSPNARALLEHLLQ